MVLGTNPSPLQEQPVLDVILKQILDECTNQSRNAAVHAGVVFMKIYGQGFSYLKSQKKLKKKHEKEKQVSQELRMEKKPQHTKASPRT